MAGYNMLKRFYFPEDSPVTVISPAGQVVGAVEFKFDRVASKFYADRHIGGADSAFDLDEAALEDLIARATTPQP